MLFEKINTLIIPELCYFKVYLLMRACISLFRVTLNYKPEPSSNCALQVGDDKLVRMLRITLFATSAYYGH